MTIDTFFSNSKQLKNRTFSSEVEIDSSKETASKADESANDDNNNEIINHEDSDESFSAATNSSSSDIISSKCKNIEKTENNKNLPQTVEFFKRTVTDTSNEFASNVDSGDYIKCDKCKKNILIW
jgi:hypothetical protein